MGPYNKKNDNRDYSYKIAGKKVSLDMLDYEVASLMAEDPTYDRDAVIRFFGYSRSELLFAKAVELEKQKCERLSKQYKVGSQFVFKVLDCKKLDLKYRVQLESIDGNLFFTDCKSPVTEGCSYIFKINAVRNNVHPWDMLDLWMQKRVKATPSRQIAVPKLLEQKQYKPEKHSETYKTYVKPPSAWYGELKGLSYHKCGKSFKCNCCGQLFSANQGYRIDFRELYFCVSCKREIFPQTHKGWAGRVISTPMGNKR